MRRLLLVLACVPLAHATTTEEVAVKCPVCDNEFKAERCNSTNGFGGQDRDLLEHARGGQVFIICCWTCPRCCYTGSPDDFDPEEVPKDLVAKLKKENPLRPAEPVDPKLDKTKRIPAWIRHDLRIQTLRLAPGTGEDDLAWACLRAAQTQRFGWEALAGEGFRERLNALIRAKWQALPDAKRDKYQTNPRDTEVAIARDLESEAADPKSSLDAAGRLDTRVSAAFLYKSRGEDADATRLLAAVAADDLPADLKAAVDDIRARVERERKYQQLAIPHFEKHLAEGKPEAEEATSVKYLLGVLYRRTGDPKKAIALFEPLLADEGIPEGFKEWIKDEIAKAKAG